MIVEREEKYKKHYTNSKGITLIALVVTIVILLILAGVSIRVLLGDKGIVKRAQEAQKQWNESSKNELDSLKITENYLEQAEIHNWERIEDGIICKHCNKSLIIGQEINYTKTGKGSSSISAEKAGGYIGKGSITVLKNRMKLATIVTDSFKIADFFTPDQPRELQTIYKDNETKWVVLGIEDSNKNGTNETLLITTKTPTTDQVTLYGEASYNNCISEINRMCKEIYGEDARGITIEDINSCMKYTPEGGMYYLKDKWNTTGNLITKLKDLGDMWTSITSYYTENYDGVFCDPENPSGIKDGGIKLGEYELNGYMYSLSEDRTYLNNYLDDTDKSHIVTSKTSNLIFGQSNEFRYWLASHGNGMDYYRNGITFGPGAVSNGYAHSYYDVKSFHFGYSDFNWMSLRPVVSLRDEIEEI